MNFSIISENYLASNTIFVCTDSREPLYSKSDFEPTSSSNPIIWKAKEGSLKRVGNIIDNGDLCVSQKFAELIISFDPFGIECYPAELRSDNESLKGRYILAINNVIDVTDNVKTITRKSPKRNKILIQELYLSEKKLTNISFNKRILFRIKGAETVTVFCEEIYDLISNDSYYSDLRKRKLDCSKEVPKY